MRESMARLSGAVPGAVGGSGRAVCTVVVLASALAACGGTSKGGETTGRRASTIEVVSGDAQTGVAGDELPAAVVVRVRDSSGLPVPGQLINFHVVAGGGGVFAGAALSDANGVARERWTLGTVTGSRSDWRPQPWTRMRMLQSSSQASMPRPFPDLPRLLLPRPATTKERV